MMRTYKLQIMKLLDTAFRIPPLFLMDQIIKYSFCSQSVGFIPDENPLFNENVISLHPKEVIEENIPSVASNFTSPQIEADMDDISKVTMIPLAGQCLSFTVCYFIATVIFFLSWDKLTKVYMFIFSIVAVILSYQANISTGKILTSEIVNASHPPLLQSLLATNSSALWDSKGALFSIAFNYIFQMIIGASYTWFIPLKLNHILKIILMLNFIAPTLLFLLPIPTEALHSLPLFAALMPLCIVKYVFVSKMNAAWSVLVNGYKYASMVLRNYGLHNLLESEWQRLEIPNVLRGFWIIRTTYYLSTLLGMPADEMNINATNDEFYSIIKAVMIQSCETSIALLGMTSMVSYVTHYIGRLFQFIMMSDDDDERSMGTVCGVLFFVLAEQSGLTILDKEKRFVRLCRNFAFMFTAMLHFAHNMVNPVLMSLSASRHPALRRHIRALLMCSILLFSPCVLLVFLWNRYATTTWLLAITAFSVQVVVKTLVSLLIYALFLLDAHTNTFWESLDDYVYVIKAFGNSVEFVFGILLFFAGAFIYFFESGGSIRAIMMCIHAYFNIWCEAKNGWSVFMKRRTAVNKINSLPEATPEQLEQHRDVCAICFQELHNARVTQCKHIFHSVCIRKWLYVQDSCPLCCETLYKTSTSIPSEENTEDVHRVDEDGNPIWDQSDIEVILGEDWEGREHLDGENSRNTAQVAPSNDDLSDEFDNVVENQEVRHRRLAS